MSGLRTSFERRYSADGWRYSVGHRTRPESRDGIAVWVVEKWNGSAWVELGVGRSYDEARTIASDPSACPYCAPDEPCAIHVNREGVVMTTTTEYTAEELALELAGAGLLNHLERINCWLERGDGIAVYENVELGHPHLGHRQYVSYGGPAAQLEVDELVGPLTWDYKTPPERLPDIGTAINWRYRLVGYYRGNDRLETPASWKEES